MKTRTKVIGGLAAILAATLLINHKPAIRNSLVSKPASETVQNQVFPYTIPGTNKADPEFVKSQGLPEGNYIVKPHPYKDGSFLVVKDKESQFHSTIPVLINSDGSAEAYRTLKQGENLDDVLKEGSVDRFVPKVEKLTLDISTLQSGNYLTMIQRNDVCSFIHDDQGNVFGRFNLKSPIAENPDSKYKAFGDYKGSLKKGKYELHVNIDDKDVLLGLVDLDEGDKIRFIRE